MLCAWVAMFCSKDTAHALTGIFTTGWQNIMLLVLLGMGANFLLFFYFKIAQLRRCIGDSPLPLRGTDFSECVRISIF
jgi:hypothetical protein